MPNGAIGGGGPHILGYEPPPVGAPSTLLDGATPEQMAKLKAIQITYAKAAATLYHDHYQRALDIFTT